MTRIAKPRRRSRHAERLRRNNRRCRFEQLESRRLLAASEPVIVTEGSRDFSDIIAGAVLLSEPTSTRVDGIIQSNDVDYFRFDASAGDRFDIDVEAAEREFVVTVGARIDQFLLARVGDETAIAANGLPDQCSATISVTFNSTLGLGQPTEISCSNYSYGFIDYINPDPPGGEGPVRVLGEAEIQGDLAVEIGASEPGKGYVAISGPPPEERILQTSEYTSINFTSLQTIEASVRLRPSNYSGRFEILTFPGDDVLQSIEIIRSAFAVLPTDIGSLGWRFTPSPFEPHVALFNPSRELVVVDPDEGFELDATGTWYVAVSRNESFVPSTNELTDLVRPYHLSISESQAAPPETFIDSVTDGNGAPIDRGGVSESGSMSFEFSSDAEDALFECSLDGNAFASCTSPTSFTELETGNHTFQVRAINASGITDPTPASFDWNINKPDFGDAPDAAPGIGPFNYRTLLHDNGPRHRIDPNIRLGAIVTSDYSDTTLTTADTDDDDGVAFPSEDLIVTGTPSIRLDATNLTTDDATLYGWIDLDFSGTFDESERVSAAVPSGADGEVITLTFPELSPAIAGKTYARFRISTDTAAENPTGPALNGEVEDYLVTVTGPEALTVEEVFELPTGQIVANIGDVDGDGINDLWLDNQIAFMNSASGIDRLVAFPTPAEVIGSTSFGVSVAALGDINGDDIPDIAVGASSDGVDPSNLSGAVYVILLDRDGMPIETTKIASGLNGGPVLSSSSARFGRVVASAGDLNGDAHVDLVVSDRRGNLYTMFLDEDRTVSSSVTNGSPPIVWSEITAAASLGDFDKDGVNDLILGLDRYGEYLGPGMNLTDSGAIAIALMNADGTYKQVTRISQRDGLPLTTGDRFGSSVTALGDVNGDGVTDVAVGARGADVAIDGDGAVYTVMLNPDGSLLRTSLLAYGTNSGAFFGRSLANLGDLDGNGVTDLAVGNTSGVGSPSVSSYILHLTGQLPDVGDAPVDYGAALHETSADLFLGALVDGNARQQSDENAISDDVDQPIGDEDGLVDPSQLSTLVVGVAPSVDLYVTNTSGQQATLYGWIDFDGNGVFELDEHASIPVADETLGQVTTLTFPAPDSNAADSTYARFRLAYSSDSAAASPAGPATLGEVEDYLVSILARPAGNGSIKSSTKIASGTPNLTPLNDGDEFGSSIAAVGDLDGDGVIDLAVGASTDNTGGTSRGAVHLLLMNDDGSVKRSTKIASGTPNLNPLNDVDQFGSSIAAVGDLNGDGVIDLAVGANRDDTGGESRGAVHLLLMNDDGSVKSSTKIASGTLNLNPLNDIDQFGSSIAAVGDLNGDGVIDLAVGANWDATGGFARGAVHLLLMNGDGSVKSSTKIASGTPNLTPLTDFDLFGSSVTAIGDLNGDGVIDLAVGASADSTGGASRGAVHLLLMNDDGSLKSSTKIASGTPNLNPLNDSDRFGSSIAAVGDLNGDGVIDLAVGATGDDTGGESRGAVHLLLMNDDGSLKSSTLIASGTPNLNPLNDADLFGSSVAAVGDLNGDGVFDLAAGAPLDDTGSINRGAVHLLFMNGSSTQPATLASEIESLGDGEVVVQGTANLDNIDDWTQAIETLPADPLPGETITITLLLEPGDYGGLTIDAPSGYTVVIEGANATFTGASPALTVNGGDVLVKQGVTFTNDTDAPTILVQGGRLTLRDVMVEETATADRPAIEITGGEVDLGTASQPGGNMFKIVGDGDLIHNSTNLPITAIGNTFQIDGVNIASNFDIEDEIVHGLDRGDGGLVTFVADNVFLKIEEGNAEVALPDLIADLVVSDPAFNIAATVNGTATLGADQQTASFLAFDDGNARLIYNVTDGSGAAVATRTVNFRVSNVAPIVDLGPGLTVAEGDLVSFTDSFSDAGSGDTHTFLWQVTSDNGQVIPDNTERDFSFIPDDDGRYTITYTVTDDDGDVGSDSVAVVVENVRPQIDDQATDLVENSDIGTVVASFTATDPGQDTITYSVIGGSAEHALAIHPDNGTVTVVDNAILDYETITTLNLMIQSADDDGGVDTAELTIQLLNQPSITGVVYVDVNQDGLYQANEPGIDDAVIELRDGSGAPVLDSNGDVITSSTRDGGFYLFEDLDPGDYQVFEQQPSGVADGDESLGSLGGSVVANDTMQLTLERIDALDYAFAEIGGQLTSGESAGIGFWQNKHGQALIAEGGTALASWLTTNFENVFGDSLAGASGQQVAQFYRDQLFFKKAKKSNGPAKVDAQFMATAMSVYFTNRHLAGNVAATYGFTVSDTGLGVRVVNVGSRGSAFGVADGTAMTVMKLLSATNALTDTQNNLGGFASIYDQNGDGILDDDEGRLRVMANELYEMINES